MASKAIFSKLFIGTISVILAVPINALLFNLLFKPNIAEVSIENKSGFVVESIEVQLCNEKQQFKKLDPEKKISVKFDVRGDCHYSVKVSLGFNKFLSLEFGYVTSGSHFNDSIVIEEDRLIEGKQVIEFDKNYLIKTICLFLMYFVFLFILYNTFSKYVKQSR